MTTNVDYKDLYKKMSGYDPESFVRLLSTEKTNEYAQIFLKDISSRHFDLQASIQFGLSKIRETSSEKELLALSTYFFLLSELKEEPEFLRDFLIDVCVWCEGGYETGSYLRNFDPLRIFEQKIKPRLLKSAAPQQQ